MLLNSVPQDIQKIKSLWSAQVSAIYMDNGTLLVTKQKYFTGMRVCALVREWIRQLLIIQELGRSLETCLKICERLGFRIFLVFQYLGLSEASGDGHCSCLVWHVLLPRSVMYSIYFQYKTFFFFLVRVLSLSILFKTLYYLLFHIFLALILSFCLIPCSLFSIYLPGLNYWLKCLCLNY